MSKYIENKLKWAYEFSRGKTCVYYGKRGRYYISKDGIVYFYDYNKEYYGFLGDIVGHVDWNQ